MDVATARHIAQHDLAGGRTRRGGLRTEHVERVAAAVPEEARPLAYLHDLLDHADTDGDELIAHGLTAVEAAALSLLSRSRGESYDLYVLRIVHAGGPEGRLARAVKLAELDDHLQQHPHVTGDPSYAWARRQLDAARSRRDIDPPAAAAGLA